MELLAVLCHYCNCFAVLDLLWRRIDFDFELRELLWRENPTPNDTVEQQTYLAGKILI